MIRIHVDVCDSTQDEVRARLADADPGDIVAVSADSQRGGRGREGRTWEDPPGEALMLSVGRLGPLPVSVLEGLPRRVADALLELDERLHWKEPNDIVDATGAKVAGILVDARTTDDRVDQVIVGLGVNVGGPAFTTSDGRPATTLAAVGVRADRLREELPARIAATVAPPARGGR